MTLDSLISVLAVLCNVAVVLRVTILAVKMIYSDESDSAQIKKRIRNTLIFGVMALLIASIRAVISGYYGY